MVKIYNISVLYKGQGPKGTVELKSAYDLQSFSFFQRTSVQEFMALFSKTIVERSIPASRQSVKQEGRFLQ